MRSSIRYTLLACLAFALGIAVTHLSGVPSRLSPEPSVAPSAPAEPDSTSAPVVSDEDNEASAELRAKVTRLEQLVARLQEENTQSEQSVVASDEQMEALRELIDDEVESYGLTHDYVKGLGAAGLSKNLIVTAEGQLGHHLTNREVKELNVRLREFVAEFKELEQLNGYVEEGESPDEFVLRIPPLEDTDALEISAEQLFVDILGAERGGQFFRENRDVLSPALSFFGRGEHVITVRPDGSGYRLEDTLDGPGGHRGYDAVIQSDELPPALRHLVEIDG
jgi:hypothetical protein